MKTFATFNAEHGKESIKYSDLTYLEEIASGSKDFMKKMIETFIELTPGLLNEMDICLKEKDWDKLKRIAHKIKPSIDFMGISSLWETIQKIEKYAGEEIYLELMPDLLSKTKRICFNVIEELKEEIKIYA
jgi:HPt (histidine-containing phosphotransfer) domain-containing protein